MKVLIISHNPMNDSENNGRTIKNLFLEFPSNSIAHLFFHRGDVDTAFCKECFCITDFDILNSFLKFKKPGKVVDNETEFANEGKGKGVYGKLSKKNAFFRFLRDLAWGFGTWKNSILKNWLHNVSPDIVFFYGSDCVFSHKIARWICKYLHIPMIIYWVDDFYLKLQNKKSFLRLNTSNYLRIAKDNILYSTNICITESMARAYTAEFKKEFFVIYSSSKNKPFDEKKSNSTLVMSYLGNISLGRYKSIIEIGKIINQYSLPIVFNVYSSEHRTDILEKLNNQLGFSFFGEIPYSKVVDVMEKSDVLLHVEDFSNDNIDFCRYSFSTKIADSLMSNRCLLCYGPVDVASIYYLQKNKCALIASNHAELTEVLMNLSHNPDLLQHYAIIGLKVAINNHDSSKNSLFLKRIIENTLQFKAG